MRKEEERLERVSARSRLEGGAEKRAFLRSLLQHISRPIQQRAKEALIREELHFGSQPKTPRRRPITGEALWWLLWLRSFHNPLAPKASEPRGCQRTKTPAHATRATTARTPKTPGREEITRARSAKKSATSRPALQERNGMAIPE